MILVAGIPTEPPLADVIDALVDAGGDVVVLNQRRVADIDLELSVAAGGEVGGFLRIDRRRWTLQEITGCYARLMDDRLLPEVRATPDGSPLRECSRRLVDALSLWMDIAAGHMLNRPGAMASNGSKPYQAQVIARHGFSVPETLITNDPEEAVEFYHSHDRVIYKFVSGVRSIVQTMTDDDLKRVKRVRACPVQFQAYVAGLDVRVHTVGEEVFASAVTSTATDYRYAAVQANVPALVRATRLDAAVTGRCVDLAADLRLDFAGIDLKITPDGEVFCFEVNPSPAYTYFESLTGQPIAASVARHLMT
jgi:hypothetical protein